MAEVKSKDSDGNEVRVFVRTPSPKDVSEAKIVATKAASRAIKEGAMSRSRILAYLKENGQWDDEKEAELKELTDKIREGERQLKRGGRDAKGNKFTKDQARELAIEMRRWRGDQLVLLSKQRDLDQFTIEGQADNAQFDYLVSVCVVDEEGECVYKDYDDYLDKSTQPYSVQAAVELSTMMYGLDSDFEAKRAENQFLVKYGFAREGDLHLINDDGKLVDVDGRLVNEDGRFIDEEGTLIDIEGNVVDDAGDPIEEFTEYDE